jgi:pyruvate formate lyase activating enzyme
MREARWWHVREDRVVCDLCPHGCRLPEGATGICGARQVRTGRLWALRHGLVTGLAADPIEKKPLYHFLPGTRTLSFGSLGCNLACAFCQNWHLSRGQDASVLQRVDPPQLVRLARAHRCASVAFTYNEPTLTAEFVLEAAPVCREAGLRTVAVTAGYISPGARADFFGALDGVNVDLKGFTEAFYRQHCGASLAPVLDTLAFLGSRRAPWLEVTTLLIPGLNDGADEIRALATWLVDHVGPWVPLHLTAFHPDHLLRNVPPTPPATLRWARGLALEAGLHHVYTGNVRDPEGSTTSCPACGETLIRREGMACVENRLGDGACPGCGETLAGVWV